MQAGIPKPFLRAEEAFVRGDFAGVEERAGFDGDEAVAVEIFVELGVGEEEIAADGRAAFFAVGGADVGAKPEVVVAFEAEDVEAVEGDAAGKATGADAPLEVVVVAAGAREPVGAEVGAVGGEGSEVIDEIFAEGALQRGIEGEAVLGDVEEVVVGAGAVFKSGAVNEKRVWGGGDVEGIAVAADGIVDVGGPS